jgi:hypothetical protein
MPRREVYEDRLLNRSVSSDVKWAAGDHEVLELSWCQMESGFVGEGVWLVC